jgi:hypothetical protein
MLIISEPKENDQGKVTGKPDRDAGWCVAGQNYLAAALGMSPDGVSSIISILRKDGWLEVVTWRNRYGHMKNKYRIPAVKLEEIKARAYKKDETGNFIRGKQEKKARNLARGEHGVFLTAASRKGFLRHGDKRPDGSGTQGLTAPCGDPHGSEPSSVGFSRFKQRVLQNEQVDRTPSLRSVDQEQDQEPPLACDECGAVLENCICSKQPQGQAQPQEQPRPRAMQIEEDEPASLPVHPPAPQAIAVPPAAPPPDTLPHCKDNYCRRVLLTETEIRRGNCDECLEWQRQENAKWVHPRDAHDWSKDKNVCHRCGTTREELKYENIYCVAPQAKAAVAPFEGQDSATGATLRQRTGQFFKC